MHRSHPYKTRIISEARAKTDKIDAEKLADLLRSRMLSESYIAPIKVRQERQKLRYRQNLVRIRTMLKNRVHSLLEQLGISTPGFSDLFGKQGLLWLKGLKLDPPYDNNLNMIITLKGILTLWSS